jgi:hypothetical protein
MLTHHRQDVPSSQPQVFRYSLDWRFLLPIADVSGVYVLFDGDADFRRTLERVGIPVSNQLSFSALGQHKDGPIHSLALPFGPSLRQVGAKPNNEGEFYLWCRRLIEPGGNFLIGFDNILRLQADPASNYYSSTPARMVRQLNRAGFQSIKIFGVLSNLRIPEYIFDLDSRTIHLALQNRFGRKPALSYALRALASTIGLARISNFLPSYFAVATV